MESRILCGATVFPYTAVAKTDICPWLKNQGYTDLKHMFFTRDGGISYKSNDITMSEDSSSSEDEDIAKLRAAVDPDFQVLPSQKAGENGTAKKQPEKSKRKELNRESEGWDAGHYVHPIKLTPESQNFIAKQLSEAIDKQIKVTKKKKIVQHPDEDYGIFLFKSSTEKLSKQDLNDFKEQVFQREHQKQKRPVIKKRKVDHMDKDNSSSSDEDSKLKSVAVDASWVINTGTL